MAQLIYRATGAPSITPERSGLIYVDTTNDRAYISTDTGSSADWDILPANISELAIDADIDFGGNYKAINLKGLDFQTFTEYTISSGVIAPVQSLASIDTEGDASTDDIDTITVATDLNMIALKMENAARVPTLKHGTGNLSLPNGADVIMVADVVYWLVYDGSNWLLAFDPAGVAVTFPVSDATTLIKGSIDDTKKVRLEADTNTPTATTIVISTPSADFDMEQSVRNSGSGTTNAIARHTGSGVYIEDSGVLIDDSENLSGVAKISTSDHVEFTEIAAPSTPASGKVALYAKSGGSVYIKDDTGTETDLTSGGGGGEINSGQNVGTSGVGVFKQKSGLNLQFKNINAGSNKITITDDTGDDEIDIDVDESNFSGIPNGALSTNPLLRSNHSGSQTASTISDFDTEVGNHPDVVANTAKDTNVSTNLSFVRDATTLTVQSSDGTNAVLPEADTTNAGLLGSDKWDEIVANTLKTSNATHTGDATGSTALTLANAAITGKSTVTPVSGDFLLFSDTSDSGNLKKCDFDDLGGGGGGGYLPTASEDEDSAYTIVSGDMGKEKYLPSSSSNDRVYTIDPSTLNNGVKWVTIYNENADQKLTLEVDDDSTDSFKGVGPTIRLWEGNSVTIGYISATEIKIINWVG